MGSKNEIDKLLLSFKERGGDFDLLLKKMEAWKNIKRFCNSRNNRWNIVVLDSDDLYQIASMAMFQSIYSYKYHCQFCNMVMLSKYKYIDHIAKNHGYKKVRRENRMYKEMTGYPNQIGVEQMNMPGFFDSMMNKLKGWFD